MTTYSDRLVFPDGGFEEGNYRAGFRACKAQLQAMEDEDQKRIANLEVGPMGGAATCAECHRPLTYGDVGYANVVGRLEVAETELERLDGLDLDIAYRLDDMEKDLGGRLNVLETAPCPVHRLHSLEVWQESVGKRLEALEKSGCRDASYGTDLAALKTRLDVFEMRLTRVERVGNLYQTDLAERVDALEERLDRFEEEAGRRLGTMEP